MWSQRYNYCLHVDQEALLSVISGPVPPADKLGTGFVNLLCRDILGGMRPEHMSVLEERDRYWVRVAYSALMSNQYSLFRSQGSWGSGYRMPPEVVWP